jgi:MoaA/NifB/PqqE/SkfB family radical SAM enzyme
MEDSFCPVPWLQTFIDNNGAHKLCCRSTASLGYENIDHNHPEKKKVRLQFLNNEKPDTCSYCWNAEEKGGPPSLRQFQRQVNRWATKDICEIHTKEDGETDIKPTNMNLILGNKCNIACVMCSPSSSTGWYEQMNKLQKIPEWARSHGTFNFAKDNSGKLILTGTSAIGNLAWPENEPLIEEIIRTIIESSKAFGMSVWISGGEVFTNQMFVPLLERIGSIPRVHFDILSNGTSISPRAREAVEKLTSATINFSLDGIGPVNDYIRYPSKFDVIERNIDSFKHKLGKIYHTICAFNVFNVTEMVDWCEERGYYLNFEIVYHRESISPVALTPHVREKAAAKIESYMAHKELKTTKVSDLVGVINMLRNPYYVGVQNFLNEANCFDDVRGTSFRNTFRELSLALRA